MIEHRDQKSLIKPGHGWNSAEPHRGIGPIAGEPSARPPDVRKIPSWFREPTLRPRGPITKM